MLTSFNDMLKAVEQEPVRKVAVAAANDPTVIRALKQAQEEKIAEPVFVGHADRIRLMAEEIGWTLPEGAVVDACDELTAAAEAVKLVKQGTCDVLMKGHIHTDDFLRAVLDKENGLRTGTTMSHVFIMELPEQGRLLLVTDGAMNMTPDLQRKAEIILNAVYLANVFGFKCPTVGVLAAVELVNPAMQATLDAAALAKMSDRNQFPNCTVDGPFALDNAVSEAAAKLKKIDSPVAGKADILLVPNIESGNMLVKCFSYLGSGRTAGVIVGAAVPIVLTSRADTPESKFLSIAAAMLMAHMTRDALLKIGKAHY